MRIKERVRLLVLRGIAPIIRRRANAATVPYKKVLVLRPDHLGDLLLSVPALRWLRKALPEAHIALLVGPWNQEAAEHIPYVDQVLTLAYPWFDRKPKTPPWEPYRVLFRQARRLQEDAWDLAVILRFDFWWGAMLAARAGIPHRAGYALPEAAPFLTQAVPYVPGDHEIEQNLRLVQTALAVEPPGEEAGSSLEFALTAEEEAFADRWLKQHGNPSLLVAIHPGAGAPVKQWRAERFSALADALALEHGATIVLTGSSAERELVNQIASGVTKTRPLCLVGVPLGQVAAVVRRCALAVGVDSGVLHLAAAVATPTVRLYGPVDPARFGPWGDLTRHRVVKAELPCVPCNRLDFSSGELAFHPCVRAITEEMVLQAVRPFLSHNPVAR